MNWLKQLEVLIVTLTDTELLSPKVSTSDDHKESPTITRKNLQHKPLLCQVHRCITYVVHTKLTLNNYTTNRGSIKL